MTAPRNTIARPSTARASSVAAALRAEVWQAVAEVDDVEEVALVLGYFLAEAAHEEQTFQGARSLARAGDLVGADPRYRDRLVEALRRRFEAEPVEVDDVEEPLTVARARRRARRAEPLPDNVVPLRRRSA